MNIAKTLTFLKFFMLLLLFLMKITIEIRVLTSFKILLMKRRFKSRLTRAKMPKHFIKELSNKYSDDLNEIINTIKHSIKVF